MSEVADEPKASLFRLQNVRGGNRLKQILQHLDSGRTELADVPCPLARPRELLIRTSRSLISAGTERMLVDFGKASLVDKARQQPERVRAVLDKVRTDGLLSTIEAVRSKLGTPVPLGYANVGIVQAVGDGARGFAIGERVVSNGNHAEMVCVPTNLCARIPPQVGDDAAAFTTVGSIALQGIRLIQPSLGERFVVTGLGLIGLLSVQLLRAHGCRVLGMDFDQSRLDLAQSFGAEVVNLGAHEDPVIHAQRFSNGQGVDGVLITASTRSSEPIHQAATICRKRGRIVLVGVSGLELSRADFYEKELCFQVSCSYGPGRYDQSYELLGHDYPIGFVRWTSQRNFEAVIDMLAEKRIDITPLVSHRFAIDQAEKAYELLAGREASLGIILEYPSVSAQSGGQYSTTVHTSPSVVESGTASFPSVAFIGAGNYARRVLIPAFKDAGAHLVSVASGGGVSGALVGRKFGFEETTTDAAELFRRKSIDAVVVATRHDSHADFAVRALDAGKHVFVEKPLCLTHPELSAIERASSRNPACKLMVGFNRRFSPHGQKMRALLDGMPGPKAIVATVNAGVVPASHWVHSDAAGGGRIVGEACHFIDFLRFLVGAPIDSHSLVALAGGTRDTASIQLKFADGSIGTIHYLGNGSSAFPKERIEVFVEGRVLQLDNFRTLRGYGWPEFNSMRLWRQDKGQSECAAAFLAAVARNGASPIPFGEIVEVSRVTLDLRI